MRSNRYVRVPWAVLLGLAGVLGLTGLMGLAVPVPASAALVPRAWAAPWPPPPPPPPSPESDPPPAVARAWPVGTHPAVLRGWEPPATLYGRGHRGVDLVAPPGAAVRAVAAGRVSFAGEVAGRGVVSVRLTGTDLRTTYEPVKASVKKGEEVEPGEVVGTVEPTTAHCEVTCLHWGLRRDETYLNPLTLLPPWLLHDGPSRLLPVLGVPLPPESA